MPFADSSSVFSHFLAKSRDFEVNTNITCLIMMTSSVVTSPKCQLICLRTKNSYAKAFRNWLSSKKLKTENRGF